MESLGEQLLTCAVCFEKLKEPKILSCHHYFCQRCVNGIATRDSEAAEQKEAMVVVCPECRCTSSYPEGMEAIPSAFFVNRLQDAIKQSLGREREQTACGLCSRRGNQATEFCHQCDVPICLKCRECHETMRPFEGHVLSATTRDESQQCSRHNESLKYFCCDCQLAVCGDCIVFAHKSHTCKLLENVAHDFAEELRTKQDELQRVIEALSIRRENLKELTRKLTQEADSLREAINHTCSLLYSTIDSTKHKLLDEIDDAVTKKLYRVKQEEEKTGTGICEANKTLNAQKDALTKHSFTDIIDLQQMEKETEAVLGKHAKQESAEFSTSLGLAVDMVNVMELEDLLGAKCHITSSQCCAKHFSLLQFPSAPVCLGEPLEIVLSHAQHDCNDIPPRIVALANHVSTGRDKQFQIDQSDTSNDHALSVTPEERGQYAVNITINNDILDTASCILNVRFPIDRMLEPVKIIHSSQSPWGIVCLEGGLMAITAATSNGAVLLIDSKSDKVFYRFTHHKMQCPCGIAVDTDGNLYVVDAGTHSLLKFGKTGTLLKLIGEKGSLPCQFKEPTGIEFSSSKIFVCDRGNHCVKVFECVGLSLLWCIGRDGEGEGQLREPADICISADNILYVTDLGNSRIQAFTTDGVQLFSFGHEIVSKPTGICIDMHRELVLITDIQKCVVAAFKYDGQLLTLLGEQCEMNCPTGIVCDRNGFVYVCDHYGNCVFVY